MTYSLSYLSDSKGKHTAIQMPMKDWKKVEQRLREAEFLTNLRSSYTEALQEVKLHRQGKKKLKTLEELLAEG
ncbi:MAG TPA: hypothetical protein VFH95_04755 [Candidatus Kapabacteria bacterium]|nr:hypothetical protein [Candidatus Kapabacteria bacterium]